MRPRSWLSRACDDAAADRRNGRLVILGPEERRARHVGHEAAVHHIDMDPIGPGNVDGADLLAQSGEIASQYRWCHENRLHRCHLDQRSPMAAISTNQMSSPTGLTRVAGARLAPARISLKIAAFSLPATRNATCRLLSITGYVMVTRTSG